jgi:tetrathionate reductase subunit A
VFADGRLVRDEYPEADWPLLAVSTKSQLFSMGSVGTPRLEAVQQESPVVIHPVDAQKYGIRSGDRVKISSPCGEAYATAAVRSGIMPGVIGIEHGFGHWGLGARTEEVGNILWHASEQRGAGIAINRLGLRDITRPGFSTLADYVVGANARQDVPVKIEKV